MAVFRVIQKFGLISFQGAPVFGKRMFGCPPGGALDQESWRYANALAGNEPPREAIEICLGVLSIEILQPSMLAACGAVDSIEIDGKSFETPCRFLVKAGQILNINAPRNGIATYLAAFGGFLDDVPPLCIPLEPIDSDKTRFVESQSSKAFEHSEINYVENLRAPIRVVNMNSELEGEYQIRHDSNRVGTRIQGAPIARQPERKSAPVDVGTIQIANDGQPIVIGRDGPVTGGYGLAGVIATADHDLFFRQAPGSLVAFKSIKIEEAQAAYRDNEARIGTNVQALLDNSRG